MKNELCIEGLQHPPARVEILRSNKVLIASQKEVQPFIEPNAADRESILYKLKELHAEAEKVYGLEMFTAFLGEGGTKIETIVHSQGAAIAEVMMDGSAKQRQQAVLKSLRQALPHQHLESRGCRRNMPQQRQREAAQSAAEQKQSVPEEVHAPQQEHAFYKQEDLMTTTTTQQQQQQTMPHFDKDNRNVKHKHDSKVLLLQQESDKNSRDAQQPGAEQRAHAEPQTEAETDADAEEEPFPEDFWATSEGDGDDGQLLVSSRPAPPGLGAAALWAREAASLKRKMGPGGVPTDGNTSFSPMSRMVAATVPMPSTNKELAVLIRDVVGARPKYGDESARPAYWPEDVPWKKGKSISQMNNLTLRRLARAVVQHQARARERSRLMGGTMIPIGGVGCGRRTKKELSALIRSKLGLRLQYGERGRRPAFWPPDVPWKKGKPLSMMNHGELSSVFSAMVGAGLCPAGACIEPPHIYQVSDSDSGGSPEDPSALDQAVVDQSTNDQSSLSSSSSSSSPSTSLTVADDDYNVGNTHYADDPDESMDDTGSYEMHNGVGGGRDGGGGVGGGTRNGDRAGDNEWRVGWGADARSSAVLDDSEPFHGQSEATVSGGGEYGGISSSSDPHHSGNNVSGSTATKGGMQFGGSLQSFHSLGSFASLHMLVTSSSEEDLGAFGTEADVHDSPALYIEADSRNAHHDDDQRETWSIGEGV